MAVDAWKNFELSGKVSDYLAYKNAGEHRGQKREAEAVFWERGRNGYGTEHSSDGDRVKGNADWGI